MIAQWQSRRVTESSAQPIARPHFHFQTNECAVGSHTSKAVGQGALGDRVPHKIEMFYNHPVECSDSTNNNKQHRNNDDNNGSLKQLLDCNGTECYKPDHGTTSTEIYPRLLWCEMLRYGRRTERHDTMRTLLQQLRISDIFNPDHGLQRYVPHEVQKTRKRTLVQ